MGVGGYEVYQGYVADGGSFGYNAQHAAAGVGSGMLGAWGGAKVGGLAGFSLGGPVGGLVGGVAGGFLGGWGGSAAGGTTYRFIVK